jgi:hypothetical protein
MTTSIHVDGSKDNMDPQVVANANPVGDFTGWLKSTGLLSAEANNTNSVESLGSAIKRKADFIAWLSNSGRVCAALGFLNSAHGELSRPLWVKNAAFRVGSMIVPLVALQRGPKSKQMNCYWVGAVWGYQYAVAGIILDRIFADVHIDDAKKQQMRSNSLFGWIQSTEFVTRLSFDAGVRFWRGFSDALENGVFRRSNGLPVAATDRLEMLLTLIENWQVIEKEKTEAKWRLQDLHTFLTDKLGPTRVGEVKRLEKICQDIHLKLRAPGRPRRRT